MYPIISIVGPTASGKSDLALHLAERFNGEIVNYDSIQVFRGFDIGSAKPSLVERQRVPHHLIDVREPADLFTAGDYQREGRTALEDIRGREALPILVGGTGLYLRALTDGLFDGPTRSTHWRERLEGISLKKGREHLHRLLCRLDPESAARIAERDKPKLIRALEVRLETGQSLSTHLKVEARRPLEGFRIGTIGLDPPRPVCYARINERVRRMFDAGFVEEVQSLLAKGVPPDAKPLSAIGYRHVVEGLRVGVDSWEEVIASIQQDTRRYAKRQLTWFRRDAEVHWLSGTGDSAEVHGAAAEWVAGFLSGTVAESGADSSGGLAD